MKTLRMLLAILLFGPTLQTFAAYQSYPVRHRVVTVEDGRFSTQDETDSSTFSVEVVSDPEGVKAEDVRRGRPFITARPGEMYSVRLTNPLPVRVAVNLTVDGLNSINGKPSGISDGEKWVIDPFSTVTIRGWQVNGGEARRFFFTKKPKSYAVWRGKQLEKDLSVNCGVIGAAFFWSQEELDQYHRSHPLYRTTRRSTFDQSYGNLSGAAMQSAASRPEADRPYDLSEQKKNASLAPAEKAGTGMGARESNPTTRVDFRYDTGMYDVASAIVIYYDLAQRIPVPNPFPETTYAPEM